MNDAATNPDHSDHSDAHRRAHPATDGRRALVDTRVMPIGLGAMPLSWGGMLAERDRAIETIHAALAAGCKHIDTSNVSVCRGMSAATTSG